MSVCMLSGRTRRLLPHVVAEIGEAYAEGKRCLLIVPEQFTLQAELELIERLNLPGFFDIEVLSPTRLTQRVFERAGSPQRVRIDTRGKHMVLRCALADLAEELTYYRRSAARAGVVDKLSALIADVKRSALSPEALAATARTIENAALRAKLDDVARVYAAYERVLAGRFVDGEDVENAMRERLAASEIADGARVWVYGFDMLTQQFAHTLAALAARAASLTVALVMDDVPAGDAALYAPVRASARRCTAMLAEAGIAVEHRRVDAPLPATEPLRHLERALFAFPAQRYAGAPEGLWLHAATTPYAEVQLAAAHILAWVRDEGLAWHEIAVQYASAEPYAGLIGHVFAQYGIPAYVDEKRPAAQHPLVVGLLCALRCATQNYRAQDMLPYLKSGFSGVAPEQTFALERYIIEYGLRGAKWKQPLARGPEALLTVIEPLRQRVAEPLAALQQQLREARDADGTLRAVWDYLQRVDAFAVLQAYHARLLDAGLLTEANHTEQVWQHLIRTLDQMHVLLDGQRATAAMCIDMLSAGLSAIELAALPPSPDALMCGQLGQMRVGQVRALVVLGLSDGALTSSDAALLTDAERAQVENSARANLGMEDAARAQLARLDVLQALTLPTEKLWLSYPAATLRGAAVRPATVCAQIRRVFPDLVLQGGTLDDGSEQALCAPLPALEALGPALRAAMEGQPLSDPLKAAYVSLRAHPLWREALDNVVTGLRASIETEPLPAALADNAPDRRYSISRLETFAACPYQHFVQYGLKPQPFEPCGLRPNDLGGWYHAALERYTRAALAVPEYPNLTREHSDSLIAEVLRALPVEFAHGSLIESKQAEALGLRARQIAARAAWTLTRQLAQGTFMPSRVEADFGMGDAPPLALPLPGGGSLYLRGRIDRIDTWQDGGREFLRIVDYKASPTARALEGTRVLHGLQQQLPIYMAAAMQAIPGAEPAGLYYFRVDNPLIETFDKDAEKIEQKIFRELKMTGLTTTLPEVVTAQGRADLITKEGEIKKNAAAATLEQMRLLIGHAQRKATSFAQRIGAGEIDIAPVRIGDWCACQYCKWRSVCGVDPALPGGSPRMLAKVKLKDVLTRLEEDNA